MHPKCWVLILLAFVPSLKATAAGTALTDGPYWFILSFNQTVTQSSTATNGEGFRAVDGKVSPRPDSCSLTLPATSVYILINFGRSVFTGLVAVHFDKSVKSNYFNVKLRIGDDPNHLLNPVATSRTVPSFIYMDNKRYRGQYLSLDLSTSDPEPLSTCEIFAFKLIVDSITFRKPTASSVETNPPPHWPSSNLVDMNWKSLAATETMYNPWMRVDLLDTYFVAEVILVLYALHAFVELNIRVGSSLINQGTTNPSCVANEGMGVGQSKSFSCGLKGRYVQVSTTKAGRHRDNVCELVINPSHTENLAEGRLVTLPGAVSGYDTYYSATDTWLNTAIVTNDVGTGHWISVDLDSSLPVAKILIVNIAVNDYSGEMVEFELRIGDSLTENGNTNPLCLPGVQNMLGKITESFFCEPRVTGRYVNVLQTAVGKRVALAEIAVYSETPPEIKNKETSREIWKKEGTELTLTCEGNGYPAPVISWLKDNILIQNGSNDLVVGSSVTFNESGTYECWANNTHGKRFKPIDVSISSDLRLCVDNLELIYDLGGTNSAYPAKERKLFANKWYRVSDSSSKKYLKMSNKVPKKNSVCGGWMSGDHPGVGDGVVERDVCVKENNVKCQRQFTVRVRNCGAFYVYNFPSSREAYGFTYCFKTEHKSSGSPAAAAMVGGPNNALTNHVFHRETEVNDSTLCLLMCSLTNTCQSFNFSRKEKICELNSSSKAKHPSSFLPRSGYSYYMKGKGLLQSRKLGEL